MGEVYRNDKAQRKPVSPPGFSCVLDDSIVRKRHLTERHSTVSQQTSIGLPWPTNPGGEAVVLLIKQGPRHCDGQYSPFPPSVPPSPLPSIRCYRVSETSTSILKAFTQLPSVDQPATPLVLVWQSQLMGNMSWGGVRYLWYVCQWRLGWSSISLKKHFISLQLQNRWVISNYVYMLTVVVVLSLLK